MSWFADLDLRESELTLKTPAMLNMALPALSSSLAIEFGSSKTLIHLKGVGIIAQEPTFVAIHEHGESAGEVAACGLGARDIRGRAGQSIKNLSPLRDGAVYDPQLARVFLEHCMAQARDRRRLYKPTVLMTAPYQASSLEQNALLEAGEAATGGEVHLLSEPLAIAMGLGIPFHEARGIMVIDVGYARTRAYVLSSGGVASYASSPIAGRTLDKRISDHLRRVKRSYIGEQAAELVKTSVASAKRMGSENPSITVQSRPIDVAMPSTLTVTATELEPVLRDPLRELALLVQDVLEMTAPELLGDVIENGAYLVGGSSQLANLDVYLQEEVGIPMCLVEEPQTVAVHGCAKVLHEWEKYRPHMARGEICDLILQT